MTATWAGHLDSHPASLRPAHDGMVHGRAFDPVRFDPAPADRNIQSTGMGIVPALVPIRGPSRLDHVLGGILRLVGLIVNGARKEVTPQIRQISAGVGCVIWVGISYGFASSDVVSTWLAIYPLFALGELVNIHRAAHDEGEIRNGSTR